MVKVIPHKHCVVCGKAVDVEQLYCSDECEREFGKSQRRQKLFFFGFLILLALLMLWSLMTAK
jgi:predicted nucleic acid-binding Zn ribbon protein